MSLSPNEIERYLNTIKPLREAVEGLSEDQLRRKPAPDKWSVTEVLSHLADHHLVVSFRIREIVSGSVARLPAFDQDDWVSRTFANEGSAADILDFFEALLVYNGLLLRRIPAEYGEKSAVNFRGETVTLSGVIRSFTEHFQRHLGQIDRIKRDDPSLSLANGNF